MNELGGGSQVTGKKQFSQIGLSASRGEIKVYKFQNAKKDSEGFWLKKKGISDGTKGGSLSGNEKER